MSDGDAAGAAAAPSRANADGGRSASPPRQAAADGAAGAVPEREREREREPEEGATDDAGAGAAGADGAPATTTTPKVAGGEDVSPTKQGSGAEGGIADSAAGAAATEAAAGGGSAAQAPAEEGAVQLPPGWEMMKTADGRSFYVNHNDRSTSWEKPEMPKQDPNAPPAYETHSVQELAVGANKAGLPAQPYSAGHSAGGLTPQQLSSGVVPAAQVPQQAPAAAGGVAAGGAVQPAAAALPAGWQQLQTAEGHTYYMNTATGVSQWTAPGAEQGAAAVSPVMDEAAVKAAQAQWMQAMQAQQLQMAQMAKIAELKKQQKLNEMYMKTGVDASKPVAPPVVGNYDNRRRGPGDQVKQCPAPTQMPCPP